MPGKMVRVILIGDVVGRYGRRFLKDGLPGVREELKPDIVIVNGENSAGGVGIIKRTADEIFAAGVDVITGGNHIWDKKEAIDLLKTEERILKPINFPAVTPGRGWTVCRTAGAGVDVTVVSLQGRVFMEPVVDNPFTAIDHFLQKHPSRLTLVDFHAEATAEKQAMGFFLDGRVSAVLGTHTHVPTADARILENGTAFQTDVGITGSLDSVIGMERQPVIAKFTTGINQKFEVARENLVMDLTVVDIDEASGRAKHIISRRVFETNHDRSGF